MWILCDEDEMINLNRYCNIYMGRKRLHFCYNPNELIHKKVKGFIGDYTVSMTEEYDFVDDETFNMQEFESEILCKEAFDLIANGFKNNLPFIDITHEVLTISVMKERGKQ